MSINTRSRMLDDASFELRIWKMLEKCKDK